MFCLRFSVFCHATGVQIERAKVGLFTYLAVLLLRCRGDTTVRGDAFGSWRS